VGGANETPSLFLRHFSLQNFTVSQQRSHFLRQAKGRLHTGQVLVGKSAFFIEQVAFLKMKTQNRFMRIMFVAIN